jgi:hypothetical protein
MQDDRFPYWRKDDYVQNFGDYCTELFLSELFVADPGGDDTVLLIGSVIADWYIEQCEHRRRDKPMSLWCCGLREAVALSPKVAARCRFTALRGPLSRDLLGLPESVPVGDSALLLPLLHRPRVLPRYHGRSLCVPHIADPLSESALLEMTGADGVLRPTIPKSLAALRDTIDAIASAQFVLAGALHAAICACAYGVPFAFLDTGHLDLPFKWQDFAASVGIEASFARNLAEGQALWQEAIRPALRLPLLSPLLAVAPLPVRPALLARARAHDRDLLSTPPAPTV